MTVRNELQTIHNKSPTLVRMTSFPRKVRKAYRVARHIQKRCKYLQGFLKRVRFSSCTVASCGSGLLCRTAIGYDYYDRHHGTSSAASFETGTRGGLATLAPMNE